MGVGGGGGGGGGGGDETGSDARKYMRKFLL